MQKFVTAVLWFGCCVSVSKQACFSTPCTHHSLSDCVSGSYVCQPSEFCEITSLQNAGVKRVTLDCRPNDERQDCDATASSSTCTPGHQTCHWCCSDANCVRQLANSQTLHITTTTEPPFSDAYGGDCATDFPNVCDVSYVQEVCRKTCSVCT